MTRHDIRIGLSPHDEAWTCGECQLPFIVGYGFAAHRRFQQAICDDCVRRLAPDLWGDLEKLRAMSVDGEAGDA